MRQLIAGIVVKSNLTMRAITPAHWVLIIWVVLAVIFWANLFRFHPSAIDGVYDDTSEGLVIGRLARAAADGIFRNTDLGSNIDPKRPTSPGREYYGAQRDYFEHPDLIYSRQLIWGIYPSHFALQGFTFAILDLVNPLPRKFRIAFYHLLASLFAAGVLVWIADILRRRFGWPAFFGFLVPIALEPMFSALAPNLYWVVGTWFVPMGFAMLLADEDERGRRIRLIALAFLFFMARFLCGYEFTSTIIIAAAVGCLLGVKEVPDRLRHILRDGVWIVSAGVAAFIVAALAHAAKNGFGVILEKAANRMTGDATSLQEELIFGKFISISTVLWAYLGGNYITLIKNYGILLALLAVYAVVTLLDGKFNWFLGPDRRKLQILALAFLASIAAPLSWFVLGKGHSFDHLPIDMILWYVPTIPLGVAMIGVAFGQFLDHLSLWKADAARSWITVAIPVVVIGLIVGIKLADRRITTQGTWAITAHANGLPIFESEDLGLQFRMTDQWFTVQYRCGAVSDDTQFFIQAYEDSTPLDYGFRLIDKQIISAKTGCLSVQAKSNRPISRMHFGEISRQGMIWERDTPISLPAAFTPQRFSDANWDRGISRASGTELLVPAEIFGHLFIGKGDHIELSSSDRRTITGVVSAGNSKVISVDGPPIRVGEGGLAPVKIIRK
ncbi:MAG TPA: hypothetical protein VHQ48_11655 [Bradyrhizobium sp.]|nr:hypothetical protein [Bradyrhizobium sp.]